MRILVVGQCPLSAMLADVRDDVLGIRQISYSTATIDLIDGGQVVCRAIRRELDVHTLRGLRFDMVVQHPSFCDHHGLFHRVRLAVLRP